MQPDLEPNAWHLNAKMRVVCQQRATRAAARAMYHPIVAAVAWLMSDQVIKRLDLCQQVKRGIRDIRACMAVIFGGRRGGDKAR